MARKRSFGKRLRAGLVVVGFTLGILLLFFLQFAIPYWIGPVGLVVVGLVDAAIYLELRRRRAKRRRARKSKGAVGGTVTPRRGPVKDEVVVTIGLIVFVLGFSIEGFALQANAGSLGNFVLFRVGAATMTIACLMWSPYEWRFVDWRTESEKYDTTDDH